METTYSSESYLYFQRITNIYIPEDRTHNHRCSNVKSDCVRASPSKLLHAQSNSFCLFRSFYPRSSGGWRRGFKTGMHVQGTSVHYSPSYTHTVLLLREWAGMVYTAREPGLPLDDRSLRTLCILHAPHVTCVSCAPLSAGLRPSLNCCKEHCASFTPHKQKQAINYDG
jgi:hypothetical protein